MGDTSGIVDEEETDRLRGKPSKSRSHRQQRSQLLNYSFRVFANENEEFDVPWTVPQSIGKKEDFRWSTIGAKQPMNLDSRARVLLAHPAVGLQPVPPKLSNLMSTKPKSPGLSPDQREALATGKHHWLPEDWRYEALRPPPKRHRGGDEVRKRLPGGWRFREVGDDSSQAEFSDESSAYTYPWNPPEGAGGSSASGLQR